MANSIVFQHSAEQLKTAVYGYDGTNYQPIRVNNNGELQISIGTISALGTINTVGTLNNVTNLGTLNTVINLGTLNTVGTVNTVTNLGTLNSIVGTVNVNLVDRTFTSTTFTVEVAGNTSTYVSLIDVSKHQDTSWYLRNITATANREEVTVQLAVTPSSNIVLYPRVLINETATLNENPKVITNDYYMRYITAQVSNETSTTQTVVIIFNGRY